MEGRWSVVVESMVVGGGCGVGPASSLAREYGIIFGV